MILFPHHCIFLITHSFHLVSWRGNTVYQNTSCSSLALICLLFSLCLSSITLISYLGPCLSSAISLTMVMCPHLSIVFYPLLFLSWWYTAWSVLWFPTSYKSIFLYCNTILDLFNISILESYPLEAHTSSLPCSWNPSPTVFQRTLVTLWVSPVES